MAAYFTLLVLVYANMNPLHAQKSANNTAPTTPAWKSPVDKETAGRRADAIVAQMTTDEKLDLIKGHRGFFIKGFSKYGIPDVYLSDASQGANIRKDWLGESLEDYALPKSVAFPNTLCLAATWNPDLAHLYGASIAEECRAGGVGILLGPGMNIYRHSQCGRNFEYLGEDPFLAARMVERYVIGVQQLGVISTLKHFVANNTDYLRRASNSIIEERALHEIYLPAFKSGIDAGAMAVMTAYNQINGEWAGQSASVINQLLRETLGFEHLVMTDWWSVNDCRAVVHSGQDLEMPAGDSMHALKEHLEKGTVRMKSIDRMCTSIIRTLIMIGLLDRPQKDTSYLQNYGQHEAVALETARQGIVLLRNRGALLPFKDGSEKNILITGLYVRENIYGGGSGEVKGYDTLTIMDALGKTYPNIQYAKAPTDREIKEADLVIVSVGTFDYEGSDRHFSISPEQEAMVQRISGLNKNNLVIVNSGSGIRMTDWANVSAILYNWYPGQLGNLALSEILSGKTNPSGRLPMTIEKEFSDSPAYGYLPKGARFMCDRKNWLDLSTPHSELNRWEDDCSIEDATEKLYDVEYKEGVLVGYRWYESKEIEPLFPFGFGLSYTHFKITDAKLSATSIPVDGSVSLSIELTNTGNVEGATVVQVYVGEKQPTLIRPPKELKAFERISLSPGESKHVKLELDKSAFAHWCPQKKAWTVNPGAFEILIGQSSRDIEHRLALSLK